MLYCWRNCLLAAWWTKILVRDTRGRVRRTNQCSSSIVYCIVCVCMCACGMPFILMMILMVSFEWCWLVLVPLTIFILASDGSCLYCYNFDGILKKSETDFEDWKYFTFLIQQTAQTFPSLALTIVIAIAIYWKGQCVAMVMPIEVSF